MLSRAPGLPRTKSIAPLLFAAQPIPWIGRPKNTKGAPDVPERLAKSGWNLVN